jgi:hypothetical protein
MRSYQHAGFGPLPASPPALHPDVAHTFKLNTRGRSAPSQAPLPCSVIERALSTYAHTLPELRTQALATLA